MTTSANPNDTTQQLKQASVGFDALFGDDTVKAKEILSAGASPFHELGFSVVTFLQAALGMEDGVMADASKVLADAEASLKNAIKNQSKKSATRFPAGMEWEVLHADATVLLGLTQALSESYSGYVKCLWSLNSAQGSFHKLFKHVFPNGLDSSASLEGLASLQSQTAAPSSTLAVPKGFLSRWSAPSSGTATPAITEPEGPVEDLIFYGTAFGYGLFNLVFSLLPGKVRGLVGFLGFRSDRKVAIQALNVAARGKDIHSTFAALTLLSYQSSKLILSGYVANESEILAKLGEMLDSLEQRFPHGSLWLLNRAKLQRYQGNTSEAILTLQKGLGPSRPFKFQQADALLGFELAWVLLTEQRFEEAAEAWLRMLNLNTWSHVTYRYLAAGCYLELGTHESLEKAQSLLDNLGFSGRKIGGRENPMEVFIRGRVEFWKRKQTRWDSEGVTTTHYAQCIRINPAEELGIFWNAHARIPPALAVGHIKQFLALTPPVDIETPYRSDSPHAAAKQHVDLDTQDELSFRDLFLGITHRAAGEYAASRTFLDAVLQKYSQLEGKWMISMAYFELAVLDMIEMQSLERKMPAPETASGLKSKWEAAIASATKRLDQATATLGESDLSSRLEGRIAMLRDELDLKKNMLS